MRPVLKPSLVNGRYGDPALYIEAMFERRAFMLDLGDITPLRPRKLLRLEHIFVSHTHIDHFVGFDRLLRVLVGRDTKINLYGPAGFIDQVGHKLQAYCWNLANRYLSDLIFVVTEIDSSHRTKDRTLSPEERVPSGGSRCWVRSGSHPPCRTNMPDQDGHTRALHSFPWVCDRRGCPCQRLEESAR